MIQLISLILTPFTWAFAQMARILSLSGAFPIYIVFFFIGVVLRFIVRPFIGEAQRDVSKATRKNARDFIDSHTN